VKILRFDDDRIGVIKNDDKVVDVSDAISARKAKGPQRVIEEIIEGWRKYRRRFEKIMSEQEGVPLSSVQLRSPLPRPSKCIAAFSNYIDRPERTADSFPNEYFYKSPDLVGPDGAVELTDIPAAVVYQPEAELALSANPLKMFQSQKHWITFSAMCLSSIFRRVEWCVARNLFPRDRTPMAVSGHGSSPRTKFPIRTMFM
jgi:hypothetical protein